MTDENYQGVGDNGVGGSWGTGDSVTAAILTEIEKRVDDELKKFKAGIQGDGAISGLAVSEKGAGADQSVDVASGSCIIDGVEYTEASTVNVALDAAHGTYARWDIITYDASAGNPSKVTGTAGTIPTIPDVPSGDIILALVLRAANDNVVSGAEITDKRIVTVLNLFGLSPSDVLKHSHDAEDHHAGTSYSLRKTITITGALKGKVRLKFDLKNEYSSGVYNSYGKITDQDDNLLGAEQTRGTSSSSYATKSQDIVITLNDGDELRLYSKTNDAGSHVYVRNFRIYFDKKITSYSNS